VHDRWDLHGAEVASVDLDPRTHEARVTLGSRVMVVVMRCTRALRCPSPLPTGDPARIVRATHVTTDESAILTLLLRSGDTVQLAGSGLALLPA
jgi:hypothetical protein